MSTWTSFGKIWTVSNCEFYANFLTFWGLHHLLFALETIGVKSSYWLIFEKKSFILVGNLNLVCSYLITTVMKRVLYILASLAFSSMLIAMKLSADFNKYIKGYIISMWLKNQDFKDAFNVSSNIKIGTEFGARLCNLLRKNWL